jgi:hypothetical protein
MDSDLVNITRKSNIKWNTPSTGCYEAPSDFRLQSMGDFSSNGNIPIVAMLNYDVMLDRLLSMVKRGFPGMYVFKRAEESWLKISIRLGGCRNSFLVFVSDSRFFSSLKTFESGGHF